MPGAIAANAFEGIRSESLAQYILSAFGTVVRVPTSDDSGIDLHCTLGERIGRRFAVTDSYSVQVKSTTADVEYDGVEAVRWLAGHRHPFLICVADKSSATIDLYQTLGLVALGWKNLPQKVILRFSGDKHIDFKIPPDPLISVIELGRPILTLSAESVGQKEGRENAAEVLKFWVRLDQGNIERRDSGLGIMQISRGYQANVHPRGINGILSDFSRVGVEGHKLTEFTLFGLAQVMNSAVARGDTQAVLRTRDYVTVILENHVLHGSVAPFYYAFSFNEAAKTLGLPDRMVIK